MNQKGEVFEIDDYNEEIKTVAAEPEKPMTSPDDRPNSSSLSVTRRAFLGAGAAAGVTGALGTSGCTDNGVSESQLNGSAFGGRPNTVADLEDNIYTRLLGVRLISVHTNT